MFQKFYEKKVTDKKASDFVLKRNGFAGNIGERLFFISLEYIDGDKELISFDFIRECMKKNKQPEVKSWLHFDSSS